MKWIIITGTTPDEMIANAMKHLETSHPEIAAKVKATPTDDPMMVEWNKKFKKEWKKAK